MEPKINYVALLIVIIVGVASGNLISTWVTAKIVEAEINKASAVASKAVAAKVKKSKQVTKAQNTRTEAVNTANLEQIREQRRNDRIGARLAKTCKEWRQADKDMNTQTSEIGMSKHCNQYENYVETGILPPSN